MSIITESQNIRIKMHRMYDENVLDNIIKSIEASLPGVSIKFNQQATSLHILSSYKIVDKIETIASIINNTIINLSKYEHPELLYTVSILSPISIIIEL